MQVQPRFFPGEDCSICLQTYGNLENKCSLLGCGHLYHATCFNDYLNDKSQVECPTCRFTVINPKALKGLEGKVLMMTANKAEKFCKMMLIWFFLDTVGSLQFGRVTKESRWEQNHEWVLLLGAAFLGSYFMWCSTKYQLIKYFGKEYCPKEIDYVPGQPLNNNF